MSLKLGDYLRRQVKVGTKAAVVLNVVEVSFWRRKRFVNSNVSWIGDICTVFAVKLREYYWSLKRAL